MPNAPAASCRSRSRASRWASASATASPARAAPAAFGPGYKVTGRATDYVRTGDQGAKFRFRFCPVCGTNLFHTEEGEDNRSVGVGVAVGAFSDPDFPPPQDSVYDCRRHRWVQLPEGITVYDKDPE